MGKWNLNISLGEKGVMEVFGLLKKGLLVHFCVFRIQPVNRTVCNTGTYSFIYTDFSVDNGGNQTLCHLDPSGCI